MKTVAISILLQFFVFILPSVAIAETRFALPRSVNGVELLLGIGPSYDDTAFTGEEKESGLSPAIALMTDSFYLDIHKAAYRRALTKDTDLEIFGAQDGLPSESEDAALLSIKSGDSFDLGMQIEKKLSLLRLGALFAADVSGTHNGYKLELSAGKDFSYSNSRFGFSVGGRYNDSKRSNYYYGVAEDEIIDDISAYEVDEDFSMFANATFAHQFTHNLGLLVDLGITSISDQAKGSPRIDSDASYAEIEAFVALVWQFSIYK